MKNFILSFVRLAKLRMCRHEFVLGDLKLLNPDGHNDRVAWPCAKCGKVFNAHCGLDISPTHGPIVRRGSE